MRKLITTLTLVSVLIIGFIPVSCIATEGEDQVVQGVEQVLQENESENQAAPQAASYAISVTVNPEGAGTVTIDGDLTTAEPGTVITYTVDAATGYELDYSVAYDFRQGEEHPTQEPDLANEGNVYTFTMPAYDVYILAEFTQSGDKDKDKKSDGNEKDESPDTGDHSLAGYFFQFVEWVLGLF